MPLLTLNVSCENVKYPARKHFEKTNIYLSMQYTLRTLLHGFLFICQNIMLWNKIQHITLLYNEIYLTVNHLHEQKHPRES